MPSLDRTLADRLGARLQRCHDVDALATAVFEGLQPLVPFAFACLATTDPLSGMITWAYKSHPLAIGDEDFARAEYGGPDINLFDEIARRPVPIGVLSHDTGGHPERCRRFRDFMAPQFGFTDEARVSLGVRGLTWGAIAAYRGPGEEPFSTQDVERLAAVHTVIADAIRRTLFADDALPGGEVPEPAVLVIDGAGRPRQMTRAARHRIEDLGGWDNGSLPAGLLMLAANARTADGVFVSRTRLGSGQWLTLRGSTLEDDEGPGTDVVVTVEAAGPADITGLTLLGRGLTAREQEITALVAKGASTKDIAGTLHLSPHTVQDHLKAIFGKLCVSSRRELIAKLYG